MIAKHTTLRRKLAWAIARAVCHTGKTSDNVGKSLVDDDGTNVVVVCNGEGFDVFYGKDTYLRMALTSELASKVAVWLVWWWVFYAWFGLRFRLWHWAVGAVIDEDFKGHGTEQDETSGKART